MSPGSISRGEERVGPADERTARQLQSGSATYPASRNASRPLYPGWRNRGRDRAVGRRYALCAGLDADRLDVARIRLGAAVRIDADARPEHDSENAETYQEQTAVCAVGPNGKPAGPFKSQTRILC